MKDYLLIFPTVFYHKVPTLNVCILAIQSITLALILTAYIPETNAYQVLKSRNVGIEDGLSQISVTSMVQDQNGNLWLGTQAGVDKFNGYDFVNLTKLAHLKNQLSGNLIYDLALDPISHNLWIATIGGLDKLNAQTSQLENISLPLPKGVNSNLIVRKILFTSSGMQWIGTNHGVYFKHPQDDEFALLSQSEIKINATDLLLNKDGMLIVATKSGLRRYDLNQNKWLSTLLPKNEITSITIDNKGRLWTGTNSHGVFVLSFNNDNVLTSTVNISVNDGLLSSLVNDLIQLKDMSMWIATAKGINVFEIHNDSNSYDSSTNDTFSVKQSAQLESNQNVISILEGTDGTVFYGTFESGLNIINPRQLIFDRAVIADATAVYDVEIINDTHIVVSTNKGLWQLDKHLNVVTPYNFLRTKDLDISYYTVTSMLYSKAENVTYLASKAGLGSIDHVSNTIKIYDLEDLNIYTLANANNGNIWLGTYDKGLMLYDPRQKSVLATYEMPLISTIATRDESVLVATIDGLYVLDLPSNTIKSYKKNNNQDKAVSDLSKDEDTNSWPDAKVITWISELSKTEVNNNEPAKFLLGTLGGGLILMSFDDSATPTFTTLFKDTKLASLSVGATIEDINGDIWVSTNNSLAKIDANLKNITFFDKHSGVNPSGYFIGAQASDSNGRIFFPGVAGLTYFHPNDIQKPEKKTKLQITKISTIKRSDPSTPNENSHAKTTLLKAPNSVELFADVILVSVHFAAIEYTGPEKIAYAYRLLGFDDRWQTLNPGERSVTFTNLSAGQYQLQLKSTNRYDDWSDSQLELNINVIPPWWQTKYFIAFFSLACILLIYLVFRWRTYHLKQQSEHLAHIIAEKTNELAAANKQLSKLVTLDPLTGILNRRGFNDAAKREFAKFKRSQQTFSIVLIDIDFFKLVNDSHGHEIGDCVLKKMAQLIQKHLRSLDIFSRWGGEEFIILMPNTPLSVSAEVSEKLREFISDTTFDIGNTAISLTITSGIAQVNEYDTLEDTVRRADKCLYQGKRLGRNMVVTETL